MKIIKIGRSSHNDIIIDDMQVSKTHCQIIEDNGFFRLIDTNSTNGTYVNGIRRQGEIVLNRGDIIRIGNSTLPWEAYFENTNGTYGAPGRTQMQSGGNSNSINIQNVNGYGGYNQPSMGSKPDNFLVWSILVTIFCCVPFGIVSIVYSSKVNSLWYEGKYDESRKAASNARGWFWAAFICGLIFAIIYTIAIIASGVGGY